MGEYSFGSEIKRIRIRKGLTLDQVASTLRINIEVLKALEADEFSRLPAEGFIRNQVSAYARFLGMDSAEATTRFLKEYHRYQQGPSRRRTMPPSGGSGRRGAGRSDSAQAATGQRGGAGRGNAGTAGRNGANSAGRGGTGTAGRGAAGTAGRNGAGNAGRGGAQAAPGKRSMSGAGRGSSSGAGRGGTVGRRPYPRTDQARLGSGYDSRSPQVRRGQRQANNAARRQNADGLEKWRPFIIGAAVVVALIVLVWVVVSTTCSSASVEQAPNVPNTGLAEVSAKKDSESVAATAASVSTSQAKAAAGVKTVVLTVPASSSTWVEATIDGVTRVAEDVTGPKTYTFEVTSEASFVFGTPGQATVTVDGATTVPEEANGIEKLTVKAGKTDSASTSASVASSSTATTDYTADNQSTDQTTTEDQSSYAYTSEDQSADSSASGDQTSDSYTSDDQSSGTGASDDQSTDGQTTGDTTG